MAKKNKPRMNQEFLEGMEVPALLCWVISNVSADQKIAISAGISVCQVKIVPSLTEGSQTDAKTGPGVLVTNQRGGEGGKEELGGFMNISIVSVHFSICLKYFIKNRNKGEMVQMFNYNVNKY